MKLIILKNKSYRRRRLKGDYGRRKIISVIFALLILGGVYLGGNLLIGLVVNLVVN